MRPTQLLLIVLVIACPVHAQEASPAEPPPATQPVTTQPTLPQDATAILAEVIEVHGDVDYSPMGEQRDWKPVKQGMELPTATLIRTGMRSSAKFRIGDEQPYTALVVDPVSLAILGELYKTAREKRVRIGVGYGKIRGGVAEGGLKSDFVIDSPVATLSKRGTWNFGMYYERGTDRYEVFLLDRGLVEALNKITNERRTVRPNESVDNVMRRWLDEAQLKANVPIVDMLGQGNLELVFNRLRNDGLGVIDPGEGHALLLNLDNRLDLTRFQRLVDRALSEPPPTVLTPLPPLLRPEGFFGTGRGDQLIEVIIDRVDPLVQRRRAVPGTYRFRRSVLEKWRENVRR